MLQEPSLGAYPDARTEAELRVPPGEGGLPFTVKLAQQVTPPLPSITPSDPLRLDPSFPEEWQTPLPPPDELLQPDSEDGDSLPSQTVTPSSQENIPETIVVSQFKVTGNTVFSDKELVEALAPFVGRPLQFVELLQARSVITDYYVSRGYITTGAFIPAGQVIEDGVVTIEVIEGRLGAINVDGLQRLRSGYISSRINIASGPPLNVNRLLEALQVLQLNPLIDSLSAELVATPKPGENDLNLVVQEADTFSLDVDINNWQLPLVGTVQASATLSEANLLGLGDKLSLGYGITSGSDILNLGYSIPLNPYNGKLNLRYEHSTNEAVVSPFDLIGLRGNSDQWEIGLQQPVLQTPSDEISLGISVAHSFNQTSIQPPGLPRENFPVLPGADQDGVTRTSAFLFNQDWLHRSTQQVIGVRSQFGIGTDWFNATMNPGDVPDSQFFFWRGQAQWVQQFDRDKLIVARSAIQLSDRPLLPRQQIGIGGPNSVRGYQTDQTLTDNGFWLSLEAQIPIMTIPEIDSTFRLAPFVDYGKAWNNGTGREPILSDLASVGIGTIWQIEDRMSARLDWGIPLTTVPSRGSTLQQSGITFSVLFSPF